MDSTQLIQTVQILGALIQAGIATEHAIADAIRAHRGDLTDEELNAIVDGIMTDAARRKALADADVAAATPPAEPPTA